MEREIAGAALLISIILLFRLIRAKNPTSIIWGTVLSRSIYNSDTKMSTVLIRTVKKGIISNVILEFDTRTILSCKHEEGEECFHGKALELRKILICGEQVTITSRKVVGHKEKLALVFKLVFPYLR